MPKQNVEPTPPVVICPIRYDAGPLPEDHCLWVQLRQIFSDSPSQLLGFISVSGRSHWVDRFNPVPAPR
jgi:hypothetical protein